MAKVALSKTKKKKKKLAGPRPKSSQNKTRKSTSTKSKNPYYFGKLRKKSVAKIKVYANVSDGRLKQNIESISDALQKINKLQGVRFRWNAQEDWNLGFVAQDVERIFPEVVQTHPTTGIKTVAYAHLLAPMLEALKQQQSQIDGLRQQLSLLIDQLKQSKTS